MRTVDDTVLRWAVDTTVPGAEVAEVRGMRDGGSPWLVRLRGHDPDAVVLRVGTAENLAGFRTEAAALRFAAGHGLPAPRLLAAELTADAPALVIEQVAGSSEIPVRTPVARLRELGRTAAVLHAVAGEPGPDLPARTRPIPDIDFAALRRAQPARPLFVEAEARVTHLPVPGSNGFVHGDLWQGNALWDGDTLVGLIDWDCAGVGPAGIDLGSLRVDAAMCFGAAAPKEVLRGWEKAAGHAASDVAYWDTVAGLSTPPDMSWFVGAIHGQGRTDLTRELLIERRDAFLADALRRLDGGA